MLNQALPYLRKKYLWLVAGLGLLAPFFCKADERDLLRSDKAAANALWLDSLDFSSMNTGDRLAGRPPRAGRTINDQPLTLKGVVYPHGVGTESDTELAIDLHGEAVRFLALVGMDDAPPPVRAGRGFFAPPPGADRPARGPGPAPSVTFEVWVGNKKAADSGAMKSGDAPRLLSVDLTGRKTDGAGDDW